MSQITIRPAATTDALAVTEIYNQGIEDRTATFETSPRQLQDIQNRIAESFEFPLLVAVSPDDRVIGWAGPSVYRSRACYAGIAEFSIYVHRDWRGRGIGRPLLLALIDAARERGFWKLVSRIFPFNAASRALCKTCGFREVGVYEKHANLEGQWLDVVIVERLIPENLAASV
jgi:L-amino acid N-acyltransferase YncA